MNKTKLRAELTKLGLDSALIDQLLVKAQPDEYAGLLKSITDGVTGDTPEELAEGYEYNAKAWLNKGATPKHTANHDDADAVNPDFEEVSGVIVGVKWQPPTDGKYLVPTADQPNPPAMRYHVSLQKKDGSVMSIIATHKMLCRAIAAPNNKEEFDYPEFFVKELEHADVLLELNVFLPNKPYVLTQTSKVDGKQVTTVIGEKRVIRPERYLNELTRIKIKSDVQKADQIMKMVMKNSGGVMDASTSALIANLTAQFCQ